MGTASGHVMFASTLRPPLAVTPNARILHRSLCKAAFVIRALPRSKRVIACCSSQLVPLVV